METLLDLTPLYQERSALKAEIKRLRAALVQIETSPQPHDDADRTEWKAAFFIATSLARSALASTGEQKVKP